MSKQEKKGLVPERRFLEFRDKGEWEEKPLGEIGEIVTGKTPSTSDDSLWNGDIQFVTPTDISEEKYQWKTQRSVVSNAKIKILPKHSIMFTCIASIGKMALSVKPCITNQQINTLIPNKAYLNEFVYYSLLNIVPLIKGTQANSTLPIINKTEFSKFTVPMPKVHAEQQKIADCLTSIDELITAQIQKLAALKTHKKGLMQQLFPAEGETVPKLRFPEFLDKGKWEDKRLEYVAPLQRGFDLPTHQLELGDVPVVYSNGVQNYHKEGMAKGPGLVTGRSGTIGKLNFIEAGDYWPHNTTLWVTSFKDNIPKFIYFLYATIGMERFASGSGVPTLNRNDVHAFNAYIPQLKDEQQKIADCLTSLDDLITAQTKKIETLKAHKKGLMQQLFPAMEEVSA